jgi:ApeA N-terminal domain 1/Apea-like HEPN
MLQNDVQSLMHLGWYSPEQGFMHSVRTPPPAFKDARLMKEFDARGTFWSPKEPGRAFPGALKFQPGNGIQVVLSGAFSEAALHSRGIEVPVLNCRLETGSECTILDGFCLVETFVGDDRHHRSEISAKELVGNISFAEPTGCTIASASVTFSHLNDWFDNPFNILYRRGSFAKALLSFRPDDFEITLTIREVPVVIKSFCAREIPSAATNEGVTWSYRYNIVIEPTEPQELHWFYEIARSLRRCFTFLVGTGVFTLDFSGYLPADAEGHQRRIVPYFPVMIPVATRLGSKYFSCHHRDIRSQFPAMLDTWFKREDELRVVTEGYAEALSLDGASPESLFKQTVQLLEHFQGIVCRDADRYVEGSVWRRFVKRLREHIAEGLPEANAHTKHILISRIGSLNNLSFRSRIEQLFRRLPLVRLMPLIGNPRDLDSFLERFLPQLEATRNYLTHFDAEGAENAFPKEELEEAVLQCWAVLTFWLANALGIDEQAGSMAHKARRAMFLVDRGAPL